MKIKNKLNVDTIGIYIILCILTIMLLLHKKNFHVDEIASYGLANQVGSIMVLFEDGVEYTSENSPYTKFLTVSSNEKFNYKNVWENQRLDVHPPLYYALLHTICSFFPTQFSLFFAGSINIVFVLLTLVIVRKMAYILLKDKNLVNILSLLFCSTAGILEAVSFLRMYVMAMFFVTYLTYLFFKLIEKENVELNEWIKIAVVALLGALTHYYIIVYLFFICIVYGVYLLCTKQWKNVMRLIEAMLFAGGMSILIFPGMLEHIFSGYRGTESIENFKNNSFEEYAERLEKYFEIIDCQIFGGNFGIVFSLLFVGVVLSILLEKNKKIDFRYILLIMPSILYFFLVAKISVYKSDRYIFPIYAIVIVALFLCVFNILRKCIEENWKLYFALIASCIIITMGNLKESSWSYLYDNYSTFQKAIEQYSSLDCLIIYDQKFKTKAMFQETSNYSSITFLHQKNIEKLNKLDFSKKQEFIVLVMGDEETILSQIIEKCSLITNYQKLGGYAYTTTYRLFGN